MSIMTCARCDGYMDTDKVEAVKVGNETWCEYCAERELEESKNQV